MAVGTVYVIESLNTGKKYVGATTKPIKKRFNEHVSASKKWDYLIHREIRTYGRKAFKITPLESANSKVELFELEQHWVKKLNTYEDGLNETIGGAGVPKLTKEVKAEMVEMWFRTKSVPQIVDEFGSNKPSVYKYLKEAGLPIEYTRPVEVIETGEQFSSTIKCAEWLSEQEEIKTENARTAIRDRLNGKVNPETKYKNKYTFKRCD